MTSATVAWMLMALVAAQAVLNVLREYYVRQLQRSHEELLRVEREYRRQLYVTALDVACRLDAEERRRGRGQRAEDRS